MHPTNLIVLSVLIGATLPSYFDLHPRLELLIYRDMATLKVLDSACIGLSIARAV